MVPAANEARRPDKPQGASRPAHPASKPGNAARPGNASRPDAVPASRPAPGAHRPAASKPDNHPGKPGAGAQRPGANKPAPQAHRPNNTPAGGKPAQAGKPPHRKNPAHAPNGQRPAAYKPNSHQGHPAHGHSYRPQSPHYRPGHAYWPGYSYRPASYVPYRHARWWYWSGPYHVVVRPFVRYYVPVYAPFVIWMGFPLVVYEETVYVSGPETVVVTETYYEEETTEYYDDEEWSQEADEVESDWSANQTYTVWEDEADETYPWEQTQANAEESFKNLEAQEGVLTQTDMPEEVNEGTYEPEMATTEETSPDLYQLELEQQVLDLINQKRAEAGVGPVAIDDRLQQAAAQHSEEMFRLNYFDHESPVEENRTLPQRLVGSGMTKYGWAGENIAMLAQPSAEALVDMWMKSQGHRENLLRAEFKFSGIAIYGQDGKYYATQVFTSNQ